MNNHATQHPSKGDVSTRQYWSYELALDNERNFLVGSIFIGYQKGNETITNLADSADEVLKLLKKVESGK